MKMEKIKCSTCGKMFDGSKSNSCVYCGAAQSQIIETIKKVGIIKIALIFLVVYMLYLLIVGGAQTINKSKAAINLEAGKAYLENKAREKSIRKTKSGLLYEVLSEGQGIKPSSDTSTVSVNYRGSLIDGTTFDSNESGGKLAKFTLNQVIKGWSEGLKLMSVGSRYRFYVPPELAYGSLSFPNNSVIPPNSTLIFYIELVEVNNDNKSNPLFDPNKTCNNFIFDGYYHYQWKIIANSWNCASISENGLSSTQNEVNFHAESNRSDKIESIEITAEIYDVSIKEKIIKEFKNKLKGFFEKSKIKLPDSLINHINIEANYNLTMSDLDISFEVDRSFPNGIYELILTLKPMNTKSVYTSKVILDQKAKEKMVHKPKAILANKNSLFDPNNTCDLFRMNGYSFYPWKGYGDWWSCTSQLQYNYLDGSINVVSFYAESPHGSGKIESIKIQADIFDIGFKSKVKKEFVNKIKEFFKKSGVKIPESLINQINIEVNYNTSVDYVNINFEVDRSYKEGYGLVLTIKPKK